jgi:hypothetical protein
MPWSRHSIQIDHVDRISIDGSFHPLLYELFQEFLKSSKHSGLPSRRGSPSLSRDKSTWVRRLDLLGKVVSGLSGFAVIVFIILLWTGRATVGSINIKNLLNIFSFTLIWGFISIGGVKMFSINANLRKARDRIQEIVTTTGGCPFVQVIDEDARTRYSIRSPFEIGSIDFCRGCHLVDQGGRTNCKVSPYYRA